MAALLYKIGAFLPGDNRKTAVSSFEVNFSSETEGGTGSQVFEQDYLIAGWPELHQWRVNENVSSKEISQLQHKCLHVYLCNPVILFKRKNFLTSPAPYEIAKLGNFIGR